MSWRFDGVQWVDDPLPIYDDLASEPRAAAAVDAELDAELSDVARVPRLSETLATALDAYSPSNVFDAVTAPATVAAVGARGLDYSAGRLAGSTIRDAGFQFVVRYVDDVAHTSTKHIVPSEYRDLIAAGVDVYLVHEQGTDDMFGGYNAGATNAGRARRGADNIGYPPGGIIFMAADRHFSASQLPTALAYLDGAASVLGRGALGCYGFFELIDACIATGRGSALWQCGIAPAASDPVHIWQVPPPRGSIVVGGINADLNELLRPMPTTVPEELVQAISQGTWERTGVAVRQVLPCPVGPPFAFKSGWLSLSTGWVDATDITVWFIGTNPDGTPNYLRTLPGLTVIHDVRKYLLIPAGTETISVQYTAPNPVGWALELFA